jgi:Methionine synthase I, cobalamin-binding domain
VFEANSYRDYLEAHGLSVQLTEALTEYWHRRIREELRMPDGRAVSADDSANIEDYFRLGYRGARYSLGYGACPDLEDRAKIVELLEPGRIGVKLSEEFQLTRAVDRRHRGAPSRSEVLQHLMREPRRLWICRVRFGRPVACGP